MACGEPSRAEKGAKTSRITLDREENNASLLSLLATLVSQCIVVTRVLAHDADTQSGCQDLLQHLVPNH